MWGQKWGGGMRAWVLVTTHLDARRERLHDVIVDAAHQPKVQKDEAAVVGQHDVPLVRVGVDEAGEDQPGGHRLARHVGHPHCFLGVEVLEVAAVHLYSSARATRR